MLKSERKQIILSQLKQDGFVTLENLTVLLSDTSESTIRRDLDELAADGQLKRVHGGAERKKLPIVKKLLETFKKRLS